MSFSPNKSIHLQDNSGKTVFTMRVENYYAKEEFDISSYSSWGEYSPGKYIIEWTEEGDKYIITENMILDDKEDITKKYFRRDSDFSKDEDVEAAIWFYQSVKFAKSLIPVWTYKYKGRDMETEKRRRIPSYKKN